MMIENIWLALAIFLTLMGLAYGAARPSAPISRRRRRHRLTRGAGRASVGSAIAQSA